MKKKIVSWSFLVIVLLLAIAPAVYAGEWWQGWNVDIVSADFGHVVLEQDYWCYWACNHFGSEPGYALHIGHGSTKAECRANASDNPVPHMTSEPYVYRWPAEVIMEGFEPGDMACIFHCCQPYVQMMVFAWEYKDIDGAPYW
jgi:hypothetical protein